LPLGLSLGPDIIGGAPAKGKAEDRGVGAMLIIARAPPHGDSAERAIELERRLVPVLDLEEKLLGTGLAQRRHGGFEQGRAKTGAPAIWSNRQGQQLGLVGGLARDEKPSRRAARVVDDGPEKSKRVGRRDETGHGGLVPRSRKTTRVKSRHKSGVDRHGASYGDLDGH
jgi:hypothetical protein